AVDPAAQLVELRQQLRRVAQLVRVLERLRRVRRGDAGRLVALALQVVEVGFGARALNGQLRERVLQRVALVAPLLERLLARVQLVLERAHRVLDQRRLGAAQLAVEQRLRQQRFLGLALGLKLLAPLRRQRCLLLRRRDAREQLLVLGGQPVALGPHRRGPLAQRRQRALGLALARVGGFARGAGIAHACLQPGQTLAAGGTLGLRGDERGLDLPKPRRGLDLFLLRLAALGFEHVRLAIEPAALFLGGQLLEPDRHQLFLEAVDALLRDVRVPARGLFGGERLGLLREQHREARRQLFLARGDLADLAPRREQALHAAPALDPCPEDGLAGERHARHAAVA